MLCFHKGGEETTSHPVKGEYILVFYFSPLPGRVLTLYSIFFQIKGEETTSPPGEGETIGIAVVYFFLLGH